jgi:hypothetical protein
MCDKAVTVRWLAAFLLGLAGCTTPQPNLKPPPQKEVLNVPPADDSRFSNPTPYPKDTLNTDLLRKPTGPGGQVDPTGGRMGNGLTPGPGFGR